MRNETQYIKKSIYICISCAIQSGIKLRFILGIKEKKTFFFIIVKYYYPRESS